MADLSFVVSFPEAIPLIMQVVINKGHNPKFISEVVGLLISKNFQGISGYE